MTFYYTPTNQTSVSGSIDEQLQENAQTGAEYIRNGGETGARVDDLGELIAVQGQQLTSLEDITRTGVTTPTYASAGGKDIVTFPDTMMQTLEYKDDSSWEVTKIPAFTQASLTSTATVDFAFLRGGLDRPTPLEVVRIITGNDTGFFGIDAWKVGIYGYDAPNLRMVKIWDSGDIKAILADQRRRYHIATGMTELARQDQLFAVASWQFAPGLLQTPRGIGCINLTGISEQAGTVPQARHATLSGQTGLPNNVPLSSLTYDKTRLMWAAIGASAT
ncbi:hypothetical protein [Rhodococcus sp. ARP2]|uniref:hypothetical protein n=1 Tax=Rhodococcus sp. ARP2 TaxID=1661385 RepID=UPI00064C4899|nr:hypothetical protein [Rhodococcus sp. ARP2]